MSLHQHICIRGQRSRDRNADDKNKTCCKPSRLRNVLRDAPLTRSAECFSKFRAAKERPREKEFGRRVGVKNSDSRVSFQCSVWLGFDAASPALFDEAATGQGSSGAVRLATRQMTRTCESMRTIQGPQRRCYASAAASNCEAARFGSLQVHLNQPAEIEREAAQLPILRQFGLAKARCVELLGAPALDDQMEAVEIYAARVHRSRQMTRNPQRLWPPGRAPNPFPSRRH
jgi:hypothetical protein